MMHGPTFRGLVTPARWAVRPAGRLRIEPEAGTDFWRKTHYGFEADNGHFLFAEVTGDFVLSTHVRFHPAHQYDQAGLMVRASPSSWLKASVEHEPGGPDRLGAVVTNHARSDWSTQNFPALVREGRDEHRAVLKRTNFQPLEMVTPFSYDTADISNAFPYRTF